MNGSVPELVLVVHMRGLVAALGALRAGADGPLAILGRDARASHIEVLSTESVRHGVRVGMSRAEAKRRCREIRFVSGGRGVAGNAATWLAKELATFSPAVEPFGDDALVIRLGRVAGPSSAHRVAQWILARIGSRFSRRPRVGIGPNVLVARMAARTADDGGIVCFDAVAFREAVGGWRVRELPGVTARIARRLYASGVYTIAQLACARPDELEMGAAGDVLCRRARGEDASSARPSLRLAAGRCDGDDARVVTRIISGTLGARIRARLLREGSGGEWMVLPVEDHRRSA